MSRATLVLASLSRIVCRQNRRLAAELIDVAPFARRHLVVAQASVSFRNPQAFAEEFDAAKARVINNCRNTLQDEANKRESDAA